MGASTQNAIFGAAGSSPATVAAFIEQHAALHATDPAIVAPNSRTLTYGALRAQVASFGAALRRAGIGCEGRVAIVMPDGPELAVAIAATACHAAAVPLNPALTSSELDSLFTMLRIDAVVVPGWLDIPARGAAMRHNACLLEVERCGTGCIDITRVMGVMAMAKAPLDEDGVEPDALALILRTSGTTAKPKLVPVSHRNLVAMAMRLRHWFTLTSKDRALCVMPLYYAQGPKTVLFTPLILGGSTACPERDGGVQILDWLADLKPTWLSAGPTFHRAMLERIRARNGAPVDHCLRFIQTGGSPLAAAVHDELEKSLSVPVLDSYGLSEAGLVSANSFAPEGRRAGTVGKPCPGELAVRGDDGAFAPPCVMGEIVVRGPGVMSGYLDDENTNCSAFTDGWFRTGDLGVLDADGFLTLSGRLKELVNRGGEKIAPAELDQALLRHLSVAEAAAFAVPHPRLGEDISAAVVLSQGAHATSVELRQHLRKLLAPFKIPRRIYVLDALPKGEGGKVRRRELADLCLVAPDERQSVKPRSTLEIEITEIWKRLLERASVGVTDDFFELGGDSLLAAQMLLEVERVTGQRLPDDILFDEATIKSLARRLVSREITAARVLIPLQTEGTRPPLLFFDGDFSGGGYYVRRLAELLGQDQPFWDLRPQKAKNGELTSIEDMARNALAAVKQAGISGPLFLGGHCNGGLVALEMARQAEAAGMPVALVIMIDPISLNARRPFWLLLWTLDVLLRLRYRSSVRRNERLGALMARIWERLRRIDERLIAPDGGTSNGDSLKSIAEKYAALDEGLERRFQAQMDAYFRAMAAYLPRHVNSRLVCFVTHSHEDSFDFAGSVWRRFGSSLEVDMIPGEHMTCITTHVEALAAHMRAALETR